LVARAASHRYRHEIADPSWTGATAATDEVTISGYKTLDGSGQFPRGHRVDNAAAGHPALSQRLLTVGKAVPMVRRPSRIFRGKAGWPRKKLEKKQAVRIVHRVCRWTFIGQAPGTNRG
jgi:hypothetical protein